jgi:hypothetical protein
MKYKLIKSFAHNFTHSFSSYENYVDDHYIVDDLKKIVRVGEKNIISVYWIPDNSLKFRATAHP